MNKKIMVSVVCTTYNQEDYIEQALNSFINQKTNFEFEIIVHDDCSTDKTTKIVKEYSQKYPNLVKPIFEKKNQYSQKKQILSLCKQYLKGKYVAVCEGDDYWCDIHKLQKQFDFMESHKDCSCVFHGTYYLKNGKLSLPEKKRKISGYLELKEPILGTFLHLSSSFFKKQYIDTLPEYYFKCEVGDYPLFLYLGTVGRMFYINEYMSVYRLYAKNSWSERNKKQTIHEKKKRRIDHFENITDVLKIYNNCTNNIFASYVEAKLLIEEATKCVFLEEFDILKDKRFNILFKYKKYMYLKFFIVFFVLKNFPWIYKLGKKILKIELINYA